jgi:release factor glutamine methyltransferase
MSSTSLEHEATVVARLRAAGCVFAEDEAALLIDAAQTSDDLAALVDRRVAGFPLEHVLGWAEFCGLRIAVDPGVFVPRRRTELLVREAASLARTGPVDRRTVVDLCCGSGAVGAALAATLGDIAVYAVDIDPAAVTCARRNIVTGHVYQGDLYTPLPDELRGRVHILVANAPYVPTGAVELLPPEARIHEKRVALDGGTDGLDALRRVISAAQAWLAPGGHLLFETSERQAPQAAATVARSGLAPRIVRSDDVDATVVVGTLAPGLTNPSD